MSFALPSFPLLCNISTCDVPNVPGVPHNPPRLMAVPCNLAWGRRSNSMSTGGTNVAGVIVSATDLLLPPRTDVRGPQDTISADMIECPRGSGRWYFVTAVDDVGKGFPNEYRIAVIIALAGSWIAPYA